MKPIKMTSRESVDDKTNETHIGTFYYIKYSRCH